MARPKKNKDSGGGASWMDTYGDLVTLLLCFFVLLFAMSSVNEQKWIELVRSFTGVTPNGAVAAVDFGAPVPGSNGMGMGVDIDVEDPEQLDAIIEAVNEQLEQNKSKEQKEIEEQFNRLYENLNQYITARGLGESVLLAKDGLYIYMTLAEGILFNSGQATIRDPQADQILTDLGDMLERYIKDIQNITVEGHTDTIPIRTEQFLDNLDLSSERANNVARFLNERCGIPLDMFWSMGRSEYDPIAPNDTPEGREKNRRVQFVIMARDVDGIQQAINGKPLPENVNAAVNAANQQTQTQVPGQSGYTPNQGADAGTNAAANAANQAAGAASAEGVLQAEGAAGSQVS